jgi:SAM-dependent methyltransferase
MRRLRRFDQGRHWRERGVGYAAEFERHSPETVQAFAEQEQAIRRLLSEPRFADVRSVLEIGAGFGRVTALVLESLPAVERYVALDISSNQIEAASARLSERKLRRPEFVVGDFRTLPESGSFDLVLAAEVFLHFPPAEAVAVIHKAQRLSARFLVHVDPFLTAGRPALARTSPTSGAAPATSRSGPHGLVPRLPAPLRPRAAARGGAAADRRWHPARVRPGAGRLSSQLARRSTNSLQPNPPPQVFRRSSSKPASR